MTLYAKLDVDFHEHRKVAALSDRAYRLHIGALCYAVRNNTNGELGTSIPNMLLGRQARREVGELLEAGLWEPNAGGYVIHDFLLHQRSKAQVEAERNAARERMQRLRNPDVRPNNAPSSRDVRDREGRGERGKVRGETPETPPGPPSGGTSPAALRALEGSNRKRDVAAATAELTLEERYLRRHR